MFGQNRSPHFRGPDTWCARYFMRSKLSISKNKENISELTSRKYALLYTYTIVGLERY